MPPLAVLSASLRDLCAQYEHQVRAIAEAQRLLDMVRDDPSSRAAVRVRLMADVTSIRGAHATISQALADFSKVLESLSKDGVQTDTTMERHAKQ